MPKPLAGASAGRPDPRRDRGKKHSLADLPAISLCAVIAGADSWEEVQAFGEAKLGWLRTFLPPSNGAPSHDTFYRLFARLGPGAFAAGVADRLAGAGEATGVRPVAVDGKAVRASPRGRSAGPGTS